MARYTSAYSSLARQLQEIELLRNTAAALERSHPVAERHRINALCRAAIVLLSAKVEAYVKELGEVALLNIHQRAVSRDCLATQFYYHMSRSLIDDIHKSEDPQKISEKMFAFLESDSPLWRREGAFPKPIAGEEFNSRFSVPKVDNVGRYLNRFGYADHKRDVARVLGPRWTATRNMVDHLVDTRNKIAHGDPNETKPPKDVAEMVGIVRGYCAATDMTFAAWCKQSLCVIR